MVFVLVIMLKLQHCSLLYFHLYFTFINAEVTFTPSTQNIAENTPLILTCSYVGDLKVETYTISTSLAVTAVGSLLADCSVFAKQPDLTLYSYSCPTNTQQLLWTIRNVTRADDGVTWTCLLGFTTTGSEEESFTINVQVPIQSVVMTEPTSSSVTVNETNERVFVCRTSGGLPAATVRWYKDQRTTTTTNDDVEITTFATTSKSTTDDLISVTSTLRYSPRKEDNGKKIYCTARNSANTLTSNRKPQLNVQYAPDGPPEIQGFSNSEACYVIENRQRILSCSISGGNPQATLSWTCFNAGTASTVGTSVTKTVTFTVPRGQDRSCTCQSSHPVSGSQSVTVKVEVLYPPTIPEFTIKNTKVVGTVKVIRNNEVSITCKSTGKPNQIQYTWKHNSATTTEATLTTNNIQDGDQYMCEVENSMNPSDGSTVPGKNSSSLSFEVLYPPTIPTFQYWNTTGATIPNKVLNVIENDHVKVACLSDSNPNPNFYQWDTRGNNQILTVSSITADKQDHKYKCEVRNTMTETVPTTSNPARGTSTSTLTVHVMYSPTNPTFKYRYGDGSHNLSTNSLSVREFNPTAFIVTCESNSMPEPVIIWENVTPSSPILSLKFLDRSKAGNYNCKAENIMNRTFGNPEKVVGRNFQSFELNILYAPEVGMLTNRSIAEGLPFDYNCTVEVGNPKETTTNWLKSDNTVLSSQMLTIRNVSRTDAGYYTCTAYNLMYQTGEQTATKGKDSQSFYLNVWYRANVTDFYVVGFPGKTSVTVNETSNKVPFHCDVNSNPGSFMTIKKEEQQLNSSSDRKSLEYVLPSASCLDAGIYTCLGNNDYNTEISSKQLSLFVNCSPRNSPLVPLLTNVTSQQNKPAVFSLTALAHPVPAKNDFQWFRKANGQWLPLSNDAAFKTDTLGLQSNLTILTVNRTLFGMYMLTVKNSIGDFEQIFHLVPEDKPEVPTNFIHREELVTESSFTVQWKPGFDNGPEQTFILKYRKESQQEWTVVQIPDTGETLMNYTVSDLSSGSKYQVVLYASNRLGNSSETDILIIPTKDDNDGGGSMALIGGLCGGGAALILIVVLVVIVFKRRGTFIKGKAKRYQENSDRKPVNEDDDDYGMQDNPMYVSAGPRGQGAGGSSGAGAVYSTVDKKKHVPDSNKNEVYAEVDKSKKSKESVPDNVYSMPLKQKGKKEKEKKEKNKHDIVKDKKGKKATQEGDIYENATPANQAKDEIIYENPEPSKEVSKKNVNKDGLIYADLTFNDQPKGQKKLVIHGLDDMTEYVQVDFTKKAEPLPDSDDENNPPK